MITIFTTAPRTVENTPDIRPKITRRNELIRSGILRGMRHPQNCYPSAVEMFNGFGPTLAHLNRSDKGDRRQDRKEVQERQVRL